MNQADMIFDLSSLWATVKDVFPYFDRLPFNWDQQYRSYLDKLLHISEEGEFHRLLTDFMESLKDGHTKYIPPIAYRATKPAISPDEPSFCINNGVLTIRLNEFLHDHAPYVREKLETAPYLSVAMGGNQIDIRSLDLNRSFREIASTLDSIVVSAFGEKLHRTA